MARAAYLRSSPLKAFTVNHFRMTRYPRNSPRAAGRIVALALISNGKLQPSELGVLEARHANALLGLSDEEWHDVIEELCADLLQSAGRGRECLIDARLVQSLLTDIDDAAMQRLVLRLCTEVANADGDVDEAEATVLLAAVEQWGLHPLEHELLEPLLYGMDFQVTARGTLNRHAPSPRRAAIDLSFLERASSSRKRARP